MEFWRKRGPVDHSVSPFVPPPFFSLLPPPPLTQQPSLLCETICLQNSIKMVQCSNLASSTTSTFSSLLHFSSFSPLLLLWLREVLDFRRWRLHVINSNTQVISWSSYEVQNTEIQLLHASISNPTLMYTRVHMFQSTFTCYHFQLKSPHSCHKAPPTHFGVTLRLKKVTKWRGHTKREKPTKIHRTFN